MRVPLELGSKVVSANLFGFELRGYQCDPRYGFFDPTSGCLGHFHKDGRNPFPYQW
jgi:hypothetical protein